MASRAEVTTKYARAHVKASKKDKGRVLEQVVEVTGWSRDNARRRLTEAAAAQPPGPGRQVAKRSRKARTPKYSYDTLKVRQKVWAASGGQCGKYLAASMAVQLDGLERHGGLVFGLDRYGEAVREELLAMSAPSIDRYLKPARATDQIGGKSTTKPSPLLRSSVKIRKAGDEVEAEPGFSECDTVAHCGPSLKGEFARTVNLTDMHTGWVFTRSVRNNAHVHTLSVLKAAVSEVPFAVTGLDFDYADLRIMPAPGVHRSAVIMPTCHHECTAPQGIWSQGAYRYCADVGTTPTTRPRTWSAAAAGGRMRRPPAAHGLHLAHPPQPTRHRWTCWASTAHPAGTEPLRAGHPARQAA